MCVLFALASPRLASLLYSTLLLCNTVFAVVCKLMHLNGSPSRSQRASFEVIKLLRRENVFIYRLGGISHKEEEEEDLRAPKGS